MDLVMKKTLQLQLLLKALQEVNNSFNEIFVSDQVDHILPF